MPSHGARYDLQPGQLFEDNYRIVRQLGRGGFGVIYLAHQMSMDRPVALKILKPGVGEHDPNARKRFLREVRIISKLRHPNTVTIHDYGETVDGVVYMVLEYVEGHTLKALIERDGAQRPMRALGFARQIARSLAEAHDHGIIHRDLKPANIMLTDLEGDGDFVKVLDFGIARLRDTEDVDLTSAGVPDDQRALIGTPRYMSPEQVRGEDLSAASDLYSLGLMLYEMLVGQPAVKGDTTMALISQQISPEPLRLSELDALHPPIQNLIRRATDKSIGQRFRSGNDFAAAIDETAQRINAAGASTPGNAREFLATSGQFSAIGSPTGPRPSVDAPTSQRSDAVADDATTDVRQDSSPQRPSTSPRQSSGGDDDPALFPDVGDSPNASNASRPEDGADRDDESRYFGVPSSQLPEPPDQQASPFAENEDEGDDAPPAPAEQEDSAIGFALTVAKLCFLGTLATFFLYVAFLIVAALISDFTDGYLRIAVAASVAIAIPLFTALGENSQKERFEVVERKRDRLARVFIGTSIFAAVPVVIISFVMPGHIVEQLRGDPNWLFEPDPAVEYEPNAATSLNQQLSFTIADMIEEATTAVGVYDGTPSDDEEAESDEPFVPPPEPTRPGTADDDEDTDPESADDESADEPVTDADDDSPRGPRRGGALAPGPPPDGQPADRAPAEDDDTEDDDDDYVSW